MFAGLPVDENMKMWIKDCGYCVMLHTDQSVKDKNLAVKYGKNMNACFTPFFRPSLSNWEFLIFVPFDDLCI